MTKLRVLVLSFHYFMDNSNTLGYPLLNKGEEKKATQSLVGKTFALTQFDFRMYNLFLDEGMLMTFKSSSRRTSITCTFALCPKYTKLGTAM